MSVSCFEICRQQIHHFSRRKSQRPFNPDTGTRRLLWTPSGTGDGHYQWIVGVSCRFTKPNSDLHFTETMASQRLCLSRKPYRLRLPGLQPRCHLISRYTYPNSDCPFRIHSLVELYKAKGFQSSDCYRATRKLQKEAEVRFAEFPFFFWPSCRCVWVTLCSKELPPFGFLVLIRRIKYFCFIESFSKQEDCLIQNSGSPTKRLFWDYRYERRTLLSRTCFRHAWISSYELLIFCFVPSGVLLHSIGPLGSVPNWF